MAKLENNKNTSETNPTKSEKLSQKQKSPLWVRIPTYIVLGLVGLVVLLFVAINLPVTKRYIANEAIGMLNNDFKAGLTLDDIEINFFGDVLLKGVKIKDYKNFEFIKAKEIQANSDWFALAFNTSNLKFNKIALIEPQIKVITYKGDSISNFIRYIDNYSSDAPPSGKRFRMKMVVNIVNGVSSIVNENKPGEEGRWLDARNINLKSKSVRIDGSDVFVDIDQFSFITKRWGKEHVVDTFATKFSLNKKQLRLDQLVFNTSKSLLMGDIILNLDPKTGFGDFGDKVKWDLKLNLGSQLSGYDLSYFVNNWDNYKPINMSGNLTGPLNKMALDNFYINSEDINLHSKHLRIEDVLKGKFYIQSNDLSADFTYKSLKGVLPTFISSKLGNFADDFGRLKFNGALKAEPKEIFANGNVITGIGQAKVSNLYLTDYSTVMPRYRGFLDVKDLNVTALTKNKQVGLITGKFKVDGRSFDLNKMHLRTTSEVRSIQLLGKNISNVNLDGTLDRKVFQGLINVNDPNAKAKVNGKVDFSTSRLKTDFVADIKHLNLNYFGVSAGNMNAVSGHVNGRLGMSNINDLQMTATLNDVVLISPSHKMEIPNTDLKAYFDNGTRIVSVDSPGAVVGKIEGKFELAEIAKMFQNSLNKILVGNPPKKVYRGQYFNLDFDVKQGLVSFFMPDLKIPNGAVVSGSYEGASNDMVLNADIPEAKYVMTSEKQLSEAEKFLAETDESYQPDLSKKKDSVMVDSLQLRINTASPQRQFLASVKRAEYSRNVLKDVTLSGNNENLQVLHIGADFKLGTVDDEKDNKLKKYAININQTTNTLGDYVFRFEPTEVKINNVAWSVDTNPDLNHSITYRKREKDFFIENLKIYSDTSELLIKNAQFKSAKDLSIDANVKDFDISKLMALITSGDAEKGIGLEGIANGDIKILIDEKNLSPLINLDVEDIKLNGEEMGRLTIDATNSSTPNVFDIDIKAISSSLLGSNNLHVIGTVDNNTESPTLNLSAELREFDLGFAQEFVKTIFGNFRGKATGDLRISGPLSDIDYSGDIGLKNFGLKLLFTGVDYRFDDTVISLSKGQALLSGIGISDGRDNSSGSISGAIQFETLSSMAVNLIMEANNLMVLNSTQEENDLFWGKVYGKGDLYVSGPVSGLEISSPSMRALSNSVFTFNSNSTSNVEEFKMLRFLKRDETGVVVLEEKKKSGANMLIDFNLIVDKGTTVNVLVGDGFGDISVRGDSNGLGFHMERNGNIAMNGPYIVDNGTFVSKAILNRTFQIARGSSINWDGNPMTPALDITANYTRTVSNAGEYLAMSLQPIAVVLSVKITETLTKPKLEFVVGAPDVSTQVRETLATKMTDESEKIIQFGSVLALNSFNVSNAAGFDINLGSQFESTGYNMLFKQLGSVLNTISNEFQVDLNYIRGDVGSNTGDRANTSVSFALSPRVKIKTGLGIPIAKSENTAQNFLSGEGIIEYDWSKNNNGSRLLRAYSKPSNIGSSVAMTANSNQSYGVGVVYSKSFNSFKSLFKREVKETKDDNNQPKAISDSIKKDTIK